jgi:hypothetical protein
LKNPAKALVFQLELFYYLPFMPYYRILVWAKPLKTPMQGIRLVHNDNINAVYNHYHSEAVKSMARTL